MSEKCERCGYEKKDGGAEALILVLLLVGVFYLLWLLARWLYAQTPHAKRLAEIKVAQERAKVQVDEAKERRRELECLYDGSPWTQIYTIPEPRRRRKRKAAPLRAA